LFAYVDLSKAKVLVTLREWMAIFLHSTDI